MKVKKKMGGEVGSRGGVGFGGQGGCERRMEVFVKIKKNMYGKVGSRGVRGVVWGGGQDRCEHRSEVFVKIKKKLEFMFMKHYSPNRWGGGRGGSGQM